MGHRLPAAGAFHLQARQFQVKAQTRGQDRNIVLRSAAQSFDQVDADVRQPRPEFPYQHHLWLRLLDQFGQTIVAEVNLFEDVRVLIFFLIRHEMWASSTSQP